MRIVLLGSDGMFGRDAVPLLLEAGHSVLAGDLPRVDITDLRALLEFLSAESADVVVNAAAFTDVDGAEARREEAFRVNGAGAENVARACLRLGLPLVHLSTDYVFPGDRPEGYGPDDPPGPAVNAYGESKLAGERALAEHLSPDRYLIVRTQWLYGRHGRNFVDTILRLARERESIRVVDDQYGAPTWTVSLARRVEGLLSRGARGTVHAVGAGGPITWFEFAREIVRLAGLPCTVEACRTEEYPRPARRPRHAWLRQPGPEEGAPWTEDLRAFFRATRGEGPSLGSSAGGSGE
ncbi:MAG: dTDP-4-dehydrorhamnose reductase [Acidobacteriota bacterium]